MNGGGAGQETAVQERDPGAKHGRGGAIRITADPLPSAFLDSGLAASLPGSLLVHRACP